MSEEDDEQLVTKPFKFVTGKYHQHQSTCLDVATDPGRFYSRYVAEFPRNLYGFCSPAPEATAVMALTLGCSIYNLALFAGFDARFPNQNQYECPLAKTIGFDAYFAKNETLLAKLCRLSQMHTCQGRRLQALSPGVYIGR